MLGWFKKKFAKKEETPAAPPEAQIPAPEAVAEEVAAAGEAETAAAAVAEIPVAIEAAAEAVTEPEAEAETAAAPAVEPAADVEEEPAEEEAGAAGSRPSFLRRLAEKLSKTREAFTYQLDRLFLGRKEIDAALFDDLEELLITADLGVATTRELLDHARRKVHRKELADPESLKLALKDKIKSFIIDYQRDAELVMPQSGPFVIMVVGVNGVGKTTTIGKIAHKFVKAGRSVMLVAGDTFRAAAVSQLQIWGERNGVHVVARADRADPS